MSVKSAQKTPWTHKLREKISPSQFLESFDREFAEYMEKLRQTDEKIRNDAEVLKAYLTEAESNFNKKEYVLSFIPLSKFFDINQLIVNDLTSLMSELKSGHFKVLFQDMDEESYDYLKGLSERLGDKKSNYNFNLQKEAGIMDWFRNLADKRSWALKALEKRFPTQELAEFKNAMKFLLVRADDLFRSLKLNFRKMSLARATRKIKEYFKAASDFISKFNLFKKDFAKFYNLHMAKVLAEIDQIKSQELAAKQKIEEEKARKLEEEAEKLRPQIPSKVKVDLDSDKPKIKTEVDLKKEREQALEKLDKLQAHKEFANDLISLASKGNQKLLINKILKYSEKIEEYDNELSLKLLSIAEGAIEELK